MKLSFETFERLVKVYYKVIKETPMTEKLEVNGSQTVHQLKVGEAPQMQHLNAFRFTCREIVEMLEGPEKEVSMKVRRAWFSKYCGRCSAPRGRLGRCVSCCF